jgi:type 1 fimbriae regulatory protein FimB/type 1 fimbriae regulatory protein FimE
MSLLAAGIEFPVQPHMLRHTTGFYLANAGQDTRDPALSWTQEHPAHRALYGIGSGRFNDFLSD